MTEDIGRIVARAEPAIADEERGFHGVAHVFCEHGSPIDKLTYDLKSKAPAEQQEVLFMSGATIWRTTGCRRFLLWSACPAATGVVRG
jgi:hypothetical protein